MTWMHVYEGSVAEFKPATATLTAGQSNTINFGQRMKSFTIQNNTANPCYVAWDGEYSFTYTGSPAVVATTEVAGATAGDYVLAAGASLTRNVRFQNLYIWPTTANAALNGTAAAGIVVIGGRGGVQL